MRAIDKIFIDVGQKLRDGLSSDAEQILDKTIEGYDHTPDNLANLQRLLSFTLETTGRYKESLETIRELRGRGSLADPRYRNAGQGHHPARHRIQQHRRPAQGRSRFSRKIYKRPSRAIELAPLAGSIDIALARVYRKLAEFPICRDFAEKALDRFRDDGNWLGMAEAYREIANSLHQEGNSEKAIEYYESGINIISGNSAPFMLGKLYTDMSGAYWFLRRPQDGIDCLEKSIAFFDQTEHVLNSGDRLQ